MKVMKSSTRKQILSGIFGGFFVSVVILLGYAAVTQMPTLIAKLKHAQDPSTQSLVQSSQKNGGMQYFVDPAGHDNNDGTSVISAFATIQKAINKAQSGDTIYLADGQYLQDFKTVRSGTDGSPIIITGGPDALVAGAGGDRIIEINHSFVQLIGFTIDGLVGDSEIEESYMAGDNITIGLKTDNLESEHQRISKLKPKTITKIFHISQPYYYSYFQFEDPWGNICEVAEY